MRDPRERCDNSKMAHMPARCAGVHERPHGGALCPAGALARVTGEGSIEAGGATGEGARVT